MRVTRLQSWKLLRLPGLLFCSLLLAEYPSQSLAQTPSVVLSGTVRAAQTKEEIPGASLALLGTGRGAKANRNGNYRLELTRGVEYRIRVTALGYAPDTIRITLSSDATRDVLLRVSALTGADVVVSADASRREARRIMQRVIDTKDAWQSAIASYRFDVYSRLNVGSRKDTTNTVQAILESVAEGFWKRDKGYAERVIARKQTANMPADVNRVALFDVQNFYNDRLDVDEYDVVGPVAHDAFDRYDYDLVGRGELNGSSVYKIRVEPLNRLFPAFQGMIWIDQNDYTIAYLDLSPNEAIKIGPVKNAHVQQTFSLVENKYLMPSQMGFGCEIKLDLPFIPVFRIEQSAVLQNYVINTPIDDTLFRERRHSVAATADSVDSIRWVSMRAIPLAMDESAAYAHFDSAAHVPHEHEPITPFSLALGVLGPNLYQFNRVEGSRFQISTGFSKIGSWPLGMSGMLAYGLEDKQWKYNVSLSQGLFWKSRNGVSASIGLDGDVDFGAPEEQIRVTTSVAGRVYDVYERRGTAYDPLINTLTSLLLHSDYPDYYRANGYSLSIQQVLGRNSSASIGLTHEAQSSLARLTDFSLLMRTDTFRANPPINDWTLNELQLNLNTAWDWGHWSFAPLASVTYGTQSGRGVRYGYGTVQMTVEGKVGGWGKTHLLGALSTKLSGALGNQQLFYFESRNAIFAPQDVFHTMYPLEYPGDQTWSVMWEQNVYDLPTRLLGITLPFEPHFFGFANAAGATVSESSRALLVTPVKSLRGPYLEAGAGIGNIFNIARFDIAWRITHRVEHNVFVTGTLQFSF